MLFRSIKSTARLFGEKTPHWLIIFLILSIFLMFSALFITNPSQSNSLVIGMLGPATFGLHMLWQLTRLNIENNETLLLLFRANREAGLLPVLFFAIANML